MDISIIVPVYNTEEYLDRCIMSILAQSYSEFELILINDGSTDNSLTILQKYAGTDGRLKVVDKTNSGVSSTRNLGLKIAHGKFICFIDADDWIDADYLAALMQDRIITGADLVIHNHDRGHNLSEGRYKLPDDYSALLLRNNLLYFGGPVAKLFDIEIIKKFDLYFNENITYGEDLVFFISYLLKIENVQISNIPKYHYTYNPQSLSTKKHGFISFYEYHNALLDFRGKISNLTPKAEKYFYNVSWDVVEACMNQGIFYGTKNKVHRHQSLAKLTKTLHLKHLIYASFYRKTLYILCKMKAYSLLIKLLSPINRN